MALSTTRILAGNETQLVIQQYADSVFVVVSQMHKIGSLIRASIPPTAPLLVAPMPSQNDPHPLPEPSPAIHLSYLLGHAPSEHLQALHSLYASQVATIIWTIEQESPLQASRRDVVLGIALKKTTEGVQPDAIQETERAVFLGVMKTLNELLRGAQSEAS